MMYNDSTWLQRQGGQTIRKTSSIIAPPLSHIIMVVVVVVVIDFPLPFVLSLVLLLLLLLLLLILLLLILLLLLMLFIDKQKNTCCLWGSFVSLPFLSIQLFNSPSIALSSFHRESRFLWFFESHLLYTFFIFLGRFK